MADAFKAPLASADSDGSSSECGETNANHPHNHKLRPFAKVMDEAMSESLSASLENLVNSFDEIVSTCFRDYKEGTSEVAPVQARSEEEIMSDSQVWWTLTGNFGNLPPINWSRSRITQMHREALPLRLDNLDCEFDSDADLDLPEDESLREAFDYHSMVTHRLPDDPDPIKTADEVISEIEHMMDDGVCDLTSSCDTDMLSASRVELWNFRENHASGSNWEENLQELSLGALNELLEDLEATVQHLNELLVHELAIRDELEFEKETKEHFLSLLVRVTKRKSQLAKQLQRSRAAAAAEPNANVTDGAIAAASATSFLTTEIPYHRTGGPPSSQHLQIYNKIMHAMLEDSAQGPKLLADYILKVHLPAEVPLNGPKLPLV